MAKSTRKGLRFPSAIYENDELGRIFLSNPEKFAEDLGMTVEDFKCPPEVHEAFQRGEVFASEIQGLGDIPITDLVNKSKRLARKHFGKDFEVALIPFGLRFRERMVMSAGGTATGSGSVTFLDGDADSDT